MYVESKKIIPLCTGSALSKLIQVIYPMQSMPCHYAGVPDVCIGLCPAPMVCVPVNVDICGCVLISTRKFINLVT